MRLVVVLVWMQLTVCGWVFIIIISPGLSLSKVNAYKAPEYMRQSKLVFMSTEQALLVFNNVLTF